MSWFSRFRQQPESTPEVEGLIGYYGLAEWWLSALSAGERGDIEAMWGYITIQGQPITDERPLTRGHVASNPLSAADFLMVVNQRVTNEATKRKVLTKVRELRGGELPGYVNGTHYSVYMAEAKAMLESGRQQEADPIVDMAFTAYEDETRVGAGASLTEYAIIAPANYWDFAVLYRKLKDYAREVMILERFARQKHLTDGASGKNLDRLEKARRLLNGTATDDQQS
jgi:hypothetical protein